MKMFTNKPCRFQMGSTETQLLLFFQINANLLSSLKSIHFGVCFEELATLNETGIKISSFDYKIESNKQLLKDV